MHDQSGKQKETYSKKNLGTGQNLSWKNFHKKETAQLISGNLDGVGKDVHVYRQIATEGRHVGRNDEDVIKSLLKKHGSLDERRSWFYSKKFLQNIATFYLFFYFFYFVIF